MSSKFSSFYRRQPDEDTLCYVKFMGCDNLPTLFSKGTVCARVIQVNQDSIPEQQQVKASFMNRLLRRKEVKLGHEWKSQPIGTYDGEQHGLAGVGRTLSSTPSTASMGEILGEQANTTAVQVAVINSDAEIMWGSFIIPMRYLPNDVFAPIDLCLSPVQQFNEFTFDVIEYVTTYVGVEEIYTSMKRRIPHRYRSSSFVACQLPDASAPKIRLQLKVNPKHGGASALSILRGCADTLKEDWKKNEEKEREELDKIWADTVKTERGVSAYVCNVNGLTGLAGMVLFATLHMKSDMPVILPSGKESVTRLCRVPVIDGVADWVITEDIQLRDFSANSVSYNCQIPVGEGSRKMEFKLLVQDTESASELMPPCSSTKSVDDPYPRAFTSSAIGQTYLSPNRAHSQWPSKTRLEIVFEVDLDSLSCDEEETVELTALRADEEQVTRPGDHSPSDAHSVVSAVLDPTEFKMLVQLRSIGFGRPTGALKSVSFEEEIARSEVLSACDFEFTELVGRERQDRQDAEARRISKLRVTLAGHMSERLHCEVQFLAVAEEIRERELMEGEAVVTAEASHRAFSNFLNRAHLYEDAEAAKRVYYARDSLTSGELGERASWTAAELSGWASIERDVEHVKTMFESRGSTAARLTHEHDVHGGLLLRQHAEQLKSSYDCLQTALHVLGEETMRRQIVSASFRALQRICDQQESEIRRWFEWAALDYGRQRWARVQSICEEVQSRLSLVQLEGQLRDIYKLMDEEGTARLLAARVGIKSLKVLGSGMQRMVMLFFAEGRSRESVKGHEEREWVLIMEVQRQLRPTDKAILRFKNPPWVPSSSSLGNSTSSKFKYLHSSCIVGSVSPPQAVAASSPLVRDSSSFMESNSFGNKSMYTQSGIFDALLSRVMGPSKDDQRFYDQFYYRPVEKRKKTLESLKESHAAQPCQTRRMTNAEMEEHVSWLTQTSVRKQQETTRRLTELYVTSRQGSQRTLSRVEHESTFHRLYHRDSSAFANEKATSRRSTSRRVGEEKEAATAEEYATAAPASRVHTPLCNDVKDLNGEAYEEDYTEDDFERD